MLQQSLPVNSIIGGFSAVCKLIRAEFGDLDVSTSAECMIFDPMKAIGLPDKAVQLVLTQEELSEIGSTSEDETGNQIKCQFCEEPAEKLIAYRGETVLACEDCANQRCK